MKWRKANNTNQGNDVGTKSNVKKVVVMTSFAIVNLLAFSTATIAWFLSSSGNSRISTVSGDMNVSIEKVTAYKYVYPYFGGSNEFVDYNGIGQVKGYVIEDNSINETVSSNVSTISVSMPETAEGRFFDDRPRPYTAHPEKVYVASYLTRFWLLGDETFTGVASNPWSTLTGIPFASFNNPSESNPVAITNVVLAKGAEFILFDSYTINESRCKYLSYNSVTETNPAIVITEDGTLRCLKSGIYSFSYTGTSITISLFPRADDSIIGNNALDPTLINFDFRADHQGFEDEVAYTPTAILNQNTAVILDVELHYKNANPIEAGLKIIRTTNEGDSMYNLENRYENATEHLIGYTGYGDRRALYASDFYCFSPMLTKETNTFATTEEMWEELHKMTDDPSFQKFDNTGEQYYRSFECSIAVKEEDDSIIIPGSLTDSIYHCYITIDYDHTYAQFFMNPNRLGKTYLLDRDFGFRFIGKQHLESDEGGGGA